MRNLYLGIALGVAIELVLLVFQTRQFHTARRVAGQASIAKSEFLANDYLSSVVLVN